MEYRRAWQKPTEEVMKILEVKTILTAGLLILSTILCFEAKAHTAVTVCNTCTTSQEYQQIAKY
ncbi:hypothetical protein, partial [Streptomyces turgidiscabies]|uniref:hypothetical protein n=1 Tax=Streptomyces turgidiscabies TaxID=85558 RepID=UPI0038F7C9BF